MIPSKQRVSRLKKHLKKVSKKAPKPQLKSWKNETTRKLSW